MLETLEHAGLVNRDPENGSYFVTGRSLELSMGYQFDKILSNLAVPILSDLTDAIGWPSDLAIFDGDAMIIVATNRVRDGRFIHERSPGYRAPLLGSALGRAYIAFASEDEREAAFEKLKSAPDPWNDAARDPAIARQLVESVRAQRYATSHNIYAERIRGGVNALGVPVFTDGRPIASLNAVYIRETITSEEAAQRLFEPLKAAAAALGEALKSASANR